VLVLTLLIGAAAAAVLVSQTAWFKNWIRSYIVREASLYLNGTLHIDRLAGNLLYGLELQNVGISMEGQPVVTIKDVGLDYNIWDFITKGLSIDNIRLNQPVIVLRRDGDTWSLSRLLKKQEKEADRRGPMRPVSIEAIGVSDGSFVVEGAVGTSGVDMPKRFDHLDAKLSFKYEPVRYSIDITHLSFRGSEPAIALNALSGGIAVRDDAVFIEKLAIRTAETSVSVDGDVQQYLTRPVFHLHISSDKLSVPELARVLPALKGLKLQPQFDANLAGSADRMNVELNVVSKAGELSGKVIADVEAPDRSVSGDVSVRHLDLAELLGAPQQKSDITGDVRVDLHAPGSTLDVESLRGSVAFDAAHVAAAGYSADRLRGDARIAGRRVELDARGTAYGAAATAVGRIEIPRGNGVVAYDVHGRAQHVNLERLPRQLNAPRAGTDVSAEYHAVGTGAAQARVDLRFDDSHLAGGTIEKGSTASFTLAGRAPVEYRANASLANVDLQRVGREFDIPALADPLFQGSLTGHIAGSGRTGSTRDLEMTASGTLTTASLFGGRLENVAFEANVARDSAHIKAAGAFADVDPAALSGTPRLKGRAAGTLDVDATIAHLSEGVTPDDVEASGRVALQPSTIGGVDIAKANVEGDYRNAAADIRTLDVTGPDVAVQGHGTVALNETGSSNFTLHADSSSLTKVGSLVDQPLEGRATVDATVTGNRRELQAKGHLVGNDVKYGNAGALSLTSDFTANAPELAFADSTVKADSRATFVTVGGQQIDEISGSAAYHQRQLDVDVTAKQPQRSLGVAGSLIVHPDHREVHLQRLGLQTAGMTWQLAPGAAPAIHYMPDHVDVADLKLVSGAQTVEASGSFGRPSDALNVTLSKVDVASVDALLLREPQLSGRLDATATVRAMPAPGEPDTLTASLKRPPQVDANFNLVNGAFRQFKYESFGGTIGYRDKGLTVDTKLQQNPTAYITAKGYVPTAVFTPISAEAREAAHDAPVAPEDRIDLHVESTPIDLGIVQGFTTQLTNVTGTLQARLDVVGSAADPHPTGLVTLQKGGFTVPATGVSYNGFEGRVELDEDRVRVGAITVLDNHFNALNVSGELAIHQREIGNVLVYMHSDDFKVIDNKTGNVRVNADLQLGGELRAPRLEGNLGLTTGTVDVDPILDAIADEAYATAQTEYGHAAPAAGPKKTEPFSMVGALQALSMDVHVTVPDDLVVKGTELRTNDVPIGLGSITVTLGGDVRATKSPGGEVVLVGPINTIRGNYTFQGRRFDILRDGTVRFTGDPLSSLDPLLDIRTERVIQAVTARVNIRGTLRMPQIVLDSTPPLEQADILSLIIFNQPANMLGANEQVVLGQRAIQIATGAVAEELSRSIEQALNVETFEISSASGTGAQLTVGQQVGSNLYFKLEQGVGDQSMTNFIIEYELKKWLRMRTNVVQGSNVQQQLFQRMQGSGVDLLFFFSY
jgi:autotransporter translocation and assembly factor TamB